MIPIRVRYKEKFSDPKTGYAVDGEAVTAAEAMCMETQEDGIVWKYFHSGLGLRERFLRYDQIISLAINDNLLTTEVLDPINIRPYIKSANYNKTIDFAEDIYTISIDNGETWFAPESFDCTESVHEAIKNKESLEFDFLIKSIPFMQVIDVKVFGCQSELKRCKDGILKVTLKDMKSNIYVNPIINPIEYTIRYDIQDELDISPRVYITNHFKTHTFSVSFKDKDRDLKFCNVKVKNCDIEILSPTEFSIHNAKDNVIISINN